MLDLHPRRRGPVDGRQEGPAVGDADREGEPRLEGLHDQLAVVLFLDSPIVPRGKLEIQQADPLQRKRSERDRDKNRHRSLELTLDYSPRPDGQPGRALHCAATGFRFPITGSRLRRCYQSHQLHLRQAGVATFFRSSSSSRTLPTPRATQDIGSLATVTGSWVSAPISRSSPRRRPPPPVMTMPVSTISAASSGGVCSSHVRTVSTMAITASPSASLTSFSVTTTVFGKPSTRSRPFTSMVRGSPSPGYADPRLILISSARRSPIRRL